MLSNLSVKSAFGGEMEVGKYNPSLSKIVRVLLCQFDMSSIAKNGIGTCKKKP